MSLETNITEYCNHFSITLDKKDGLEPWFKSVTTFTDKFIAESNELANDIKYNNINVRIGENNAPVYGGYCSLNTSILPDVFTNRVNNNQSNFFPEVGMMFIKTYMSQLVGKDRCLPPEKLHTIFNKNQELIEIPYPIALYLGGLFYFTLGESGNNIILPQNSETLFSRINGVPLNYTQDKVKYDPTQTGNDIYNHVDLYRRPTLYGSTGGAMPVLERLYYPSVRILNRSIYGDFIQTNASDLETDFDIKTGYDLTNGGKVDIVEKISIPHKSAMPPVGYGIQNKFLNHYNKVMFGDYLSGTTDLKNDGKPHVIAGGHSGIIKPIKTYDSNDIEFTAFYRNGYIGNFNYKIDDIKTELSNATNGLKKHPEKLDPNFYPNSQKSIIKAFIAFSKLKANFLSGSIADKKALKDAITVLSSVKNIDSQFNVDFKKSIVAPLIATDLFDLYFLVSHVFFTSFKNENPKSYLIKDDNLYGLVGASGSKLDIPNIFSVDCRLSYGYRSTITSHRLYQTVLPETLDKTLNFNFNTLTQQIDNLTDFLDYLWTLEKINFRDKFNKVDNKASYLLYPSCGGSISPNYLLHSPWLSDVSGSGLKLGNINFIERGINDTNITKLSELLYKDSNDKVTYNPALENATVGLAQANKFKDDEFKNLTLCDPKGASTPLAALSWAMDFLHPNAFLTSEVVTNLYFDVSKVDVLTGIYNSKNGNLNLNNPNKSLYLMNKEFNRGALLNDPSSFDNHTILKNTTRFLWFDNTKVGSNLSMDSVLGGGIYENKSGIDELTSNIYGWNYFKTNHLYVSSVSDNIEYDKTGYFEQFKIANLLDSLNFTQLYHFKSLFLDFCKFGSETYIKKGFNLKSLMLASSVVTYDEIKEFTDPKTSIKLSGEEINLALIGNSMYNYEFMAEIGLSKFLNVALTLSQKDKTYSVIDEFCSDTIVHTNYSPSNSIYYNESTPDLSLHTLITQPEILFSNKMTYSEIATDLGKTVDDTDTIRYFSRKALFGDTYIAPYTSVTKAEKDGIIYLNGLYMVNKLFTKYDPNTKHGVTDVDLNDLYATIVIKFFEFLNIKYTPSMYYFLNKFIRTYVYRVLADLNVLNDEYLPANPLVEHAVLFERYVRPVEQEQERVRILLEKRLKEEESKKVNDIIKESAFSFGDVYSGGVVKPTGLGRQL